MRVVEPGPRESRRATGANRIGGLAVIGRLGGKPGTLLARREGDAKLVVLRMPLAAAQRDAFRARARALAGVRHPALVPIVDVGEHVEEDGDEPVPFAVEEHKSGGSLREILDALHGLPVAEARMRARDQLPGSGSFEARAAALGAQIADALDALHSAGVAHGAVQPSAILFERPEGSGAEPTVALGGFRLDEEARWADGLGYAAPELVRDRGEATVAADVIGLATTLYELFALRPAFEGEDPASLARAVREHEPARPTALQPFLRREADAVLLRAMDKNPARRPASAAELARDLRALASGRAVAARPPAAWRRLLGRLWERRRALFKLGALALVFGLAVLAGV
jgi:serine/threonine protein kinase